eukprot:g7523.t1
METSWKSSLKWHQFDEFGNDTVATRFWWRYVKRKDRNSGTSGFFTYQCVQITMVVDIGRCPADGDEHTFVPLWEPVGFVTNTCNMYPGWLCSKCNNLIRVRTPADSD